MIKVYYNSKLAKLILGKNYSTITIAKWVFTKKSTLPDYVINEETTHYLQWRDVFVMSLFCALVFANLKLWKPCLVGIALSPVMYYIMYLNMQIVELCRGIGKMEYTKGFRYWNHQAYLRNNMEREAKDNRFNNDYNKGRVMFEFLKYF